MELRAKEMTIVWSCTIRVLSCIQSTRFTTVFSMTYSLCSPQNTRTMHQTVEMKSFINQYGPDSQHDSTRVASQRVLSVESYTEMPTARRVEDLTESHQAVA